MRTNNPLKRLSRAGSAPEIRDILPPLYPWMTNVPRKDERNARMLFLSNHDYPHRRTRECGLPPAALPGACPERSRRAVFERREFCGMAVNYFSSRSVFPLSADFLAASRISTTIMLVSSDVSPSGFVP